MILHNFLTNFSLPFDVGISKLRHENNFFACEFPSPFPSRGNQKRKQRSECVVAGESVGASHESNAKIEARNGGHESDKISS